MPVSAPPRVRSDGLLGVSPTLSFFFLKQKTAYEWRIGDWSPDVCSSDLARRRRFCPIRPVEARTLGKQLRSGGYRFQGYAWRRSAHARQYEILHAAHGPALLHHA